MVSLTVGIENSDFVCRWFLLHVFKPSTQSRSTISLLPCCLTELCLGVCYCMCCAISAPGYNNNKNWKYICFFSFKRNPLNINFCYRGLPDTWYLEWYSGVYHSSATVAIAGGIDWNNQCCCLCWLLALGLLNVSKTVLKHQITVFCDQPPESLKPQEAWATPNSGPSLCSGNASSGVIWVSSSLRGNISLRKLNIHMFTLLLLLPHFFLG